MDLYISSMLLGAAGLGAMALGGLGVRGGGHGHGASHAGHVHGTSSHATNGAHAHGAQAGAQSALNSAARANGPAMLWALSIPRLLFSLFLGFGATGEVLKPFVGDPLRFAGAILGALLFERFLVTPLWNFSMRFASTPALTLESAVLDEATAVTSFDSNGQGIVSIELDGQVIQVLATLQPTDRQLGVRVRAGQRVRIDDVDAEQNRCTVSVL